VLLGLGGAGIGVMYPVTSTIVQNIVAPQGTAFTDQHARILKRYADEAVLCFDSDEAGQNAIVRSLDHLLASGLAVRVAVVPRPHDPDSFIKANGAEAFRQLIERAEGFLLLPFLLPLCFGRSKVVSVFHPIAFDVASDAGFIILGNPKARQTKGRALHGKPSQLACEPRYFPMQYSFVLVRT